MLCCFLLRYARMKIAVIGKGGREHALVEALAASPCAPSIYSFPGSDAILSIAQPVDAHDLDSLMDWMVKEKIDLCVAGEESYLVLGKGLANRCHEVGIPCWGPTKESAQLEASKEFSKNFLLRHNIPTATATVVNDAESAKQAIAGRYPTVLKFDGLAAGKGVAVCATEQEADDFLDEILVQRRFGEGRLLVEECLVGPEISIFGAICDDQYLILCPARDYKRLGEGDLGPNTGGMGAVASRQLASPELLAQIEEQIVIPTVKGLQKDGLPYRGFLYFGLMLTAEGPKVIEYNCRFGDPECEAVMPLLQGDLARFCLQGARGDFDSSLISFSDAWSVCCILASAGYPASSRNDDLITGLDDCAARVYHCGTKKTEAGWVTAGGRVLAIVAQGDSLEEARSLAHAEAAKVNFDGSQRRADIAYMNM